MAQRGWARAVPPLCALLLGAACSRAPDQVAAASPPSGPGWPRAPSASGEQAWPVRAPGWPAESQVNPVSVQRDWPIELGAELVPTGLSLAGGAGEDGLVVDGAGMVWVDGPWQVARIDPTTGAGRVWDAGDDAAFATVATVARTAMAGVWLVEPERLRLFDGRRFAVDLAVPAAYRGASGVAAMVERDGEAWIGTDAGVARWSDGQWSAVGLGRVSDVTTLAVDGEGQVWASGRIATSTGWRRGVARFDGRAWQVPDAVAAPIGPVDEIDADSRGGVVVRQGVRNPRILRFEGGRWSDLTPGLSATRPGELGRDAVAVAPDGTIWVAGGVGVASRAPYGAWEAVGEPGTGRLSGSADQPPPSGLAHVGGSLIGADRSGVVRLAGSGFTRLWRDPAMPAGDILGDGRLGSGLVAVSTSEAWADARSTGFWLPRMVRFRGDRWSTTDPPETAFGDDGLAGVPLLATDGALWQVTAEGLARFDGSAWTVLDPDLVGAGLWPGGAVAGPQGSLWLLTPGLAEMPVEIRPDGRRREVVLPAGLGASSVTAVAAGQRRGAWVVLTGAGAVWWDGAQWGEAVPLPAGYAAAASAVIGGDGALWVDLRPRDPQAQNAVARLSGSRWELFDVAAHTLQRSKDGICAVAGPAPREGQWAGFLSVPVVFSSVICLDAAGVSRVTRIPVPVRTVAIASDGGVWIVDEQLARLARRVG